MKKIISICLVILLLMLSLASCNGETPDPEPADSSADSTQNDLQNDTSEEAEITAKSYAKAYAAAADEVFPALDASEKASFVSRMSFVSPSETTDRNYFAVGAYLLFLRNLYNTEGYEITDDAVALTATAKMTIEGNYGEQTMNAVIRSYLAEDGILRNDIYEAEPENEGSRGVIRIDIDYDFETDTLSGFEMSLLVYSSGELLQFNYYAFDGESIKILDTAVEDSDYTSALAEAEARSADIASKASAAKNIGDYSAQYTAAMIEQVRRVYPDVTVTSQKELV